MSDPSAATLNRLLESLDRLVKVQVDLQEELNSERRRVNALQNENDTLALALERERSLRKEAEDRLAKVSTAASMNPVVPQPSAPPARVPPQAPPPSRPRDPIGSGVESEFLKEAYRRRLLGNHD